MGFQRSQYDDDEPTRKALSVNAIQLYRILKRKQMRVAQLPGFSGDDVMAYEEYLVTNDKEFAEEMCSGRNGEYVAEPFAAYYPN